MKRIVPKRRDFYVYALFDENAIPRYIGKGHGNRWLSHERGNDKNNKLKNRFIKHTLAALGEVPKVKIRQDLTEAEAFEIEVAFIKAIGRYPNGPLVNLTDNRNGPSSERIKAWHASRTVEERKITARKMQEAMTPEKKQERIRKWKLSVDREKLSQNAKAMQARRTPDQRRAYGIKGGLASAAKSTLEQKQEWGRKGIASYLKNSTPEQRRENHLKTGVAKLTKEQLSANGTKGATKANNNRTPEERSILSRKAAMALYGNLTREQRVEKAKHAAKFANVTTEARSRGNRKRAKTLGPEWLRAQALKMVEARRQKRLLRASIQGPGASSP